MYFKKIRERLKEGKIIYDKDLNVCYYTRISNNKLDSLENQKKYCEKMIKRNNIKNLIHSYIDKYIFGIAVKHKLF